MLFQMFYNIGKAIPALHKINRMDVNKGHIEKTVTRAFEKAFCRHSLRGSMTVEAALVIPMIFFVWIACMSWTSMVRIHETVQHELTETAIELSIAAGKNQDMVKKQVGKSQLFTKESLTKIQDKMRNACLKSFNKLYDMDIKLKEKQKGRNQDINVKDMSNYSNIKKQLAEKEKKLDKANKQTNKLDNTTKDINQILDNLKPAKFNKNNMVISNEDIEKIKNFTKDVKDTTKTVRSVNDLNIAIRDFEHSAFEIEKENRSLKYQIEEKDKEIYNLKGELSTKDKIINKLKEEKESIKAQLHKFKEFWHNIMGHFHKRICYDKDNNYKIVSDDLYKNGIFNDDEN